MYRLTWKCLMGTFDNISNRELNFFSRLLPVLIKIESQCVFTKLKKMTWSIVSFEVEGNSSLFNPSIQYLVSLITDLCSQG